MREYNKQIGPWLDHDRAEQRHQAYGWIIKEVPGHGFRRVVSSPPPIEIVEIEGIKKLVNANMVVITSGGGGIPVIIDTRNTMEGVEAVVDTDQVATILANQIHAKILLDVINDDKDFSAIGLSTEEYQHLSPQNLSKILENKEVFSNHIRRKLCSANKFLNEGGEQVIITTLHKFQLTMQKQSGIWIGVDKPTINLQELYS